MQIVWLPPCQRNCVSSTLSTLGKWCRLNPNSFKTVLLKEHSVPVFWRLFFLTVQRPMISPCAWHSSTPNMKTPLCLTSKCPVRMQHIPPLIYFLPSYTQLFFYTSAYHGHLKSLIDLSPYKFRKLTGQKEWVHVVCKFTQQSWRKPLTHTGLLLTWRKMCFILIRHPYQTPTEACTERTIPTRARHMLIL